MADQVPTTCPMPDLDSIRKGDKPGQEELVVALRNIINTLNSYIVRKG